MDTFFNKLIGSVLVIGTNAFAQTSPEIPASTPPATPPASESASAKIVEQTIAAPAPAAVVAAPKTSNDQLPLCPPVTPFQSGYGADDHYPAAYNAPARIELKKSWDFNLSGSFLYWYAAQDEMELAVNSTYTTQYETSPANGKYVVQNFNFKPGFKCALGVEFDHDSWNGLIEYTWFHQSSMTNRGVPPADIRGGSPLWRMMGWFSNINAANGQFTFAASLDSKWRSNLDFVDMTLSRPFYRGRQLTIDPFGGIRAASIRQNLRLAIQQYSGSPTAPLAWNPVVSHNHSNCWAIGPKVGLDANWLLGWGFRFEGDVSGSLLYTRFTSVAHREEVADSTGAGASTILSAEISDMNTLRPMADMKIGMGWGTYFFRQTYHFDLLATYDFYMLWGQNMMRHLVGPLFFNESTAIGDLSLQGLNITARFDF